MCHLWKVERVEPAPVVIVFEVDLGVKLDLEPAEARPVPALHPGEKDPRQLQVLVADGLNSYGACV